MIDEVPDQDYVAEVLRFLKKGGDGDVTLYIYANWHMRGGAICCELELYSTSVLSEERSTYPYLPVAHIVGNKLNCIPWVSGVHYRSVPSIVAMHAESLVERLLQFIAKLTTRALVSRCTRY